MAKINGTPVSYWLSVTLPELALWIQDSNYLAAEAQAKLKNRNKR